MIQQAMILAAGKGERMRPLTNDTPKPLLCVAGKPLIVWHLEELKRAGVRRVVINAAYLWQKIERFFEQSDFGMDIALSVEKDGGLETAGGARFALDQGLLADAPFLLINGDVWCDADRKALLDDLGDAQARLYLVKNPSHNPSGDFVFEGGQVDNPTVNDTRPTRTFSGISALDPRILADFAGGRAPLAPFLRQAVDQGQARAQELEGHWVDVGAPERLLALESYLISNKINGL